MSDLKATMAARTRLPIELLSRINAYTADWVGLENLCQVFPQVEKLFAGEPNSKADPEAIRLMESILNLNPIMSHELHRYFRMTMKLRQPTLVDESAAIFMARDYSSSSMTVSSSITRAMLQETVMIAANIQRLACACLTILLTRVREVKPRRWELVQRPGEDYSRVTGTVPYEPRDAGSPSWIEEYRVYHALWHLQLHSDLLITAKRLKWPQSDPENLWSNDIDWNQKPPRSADEIRAISECLQDLLRVDTDHTQKPSVESKNSDVALLTKLPSATQLSCKFDIWSPPLPPIILDYHAPDIPNDVWGQGTNMTRRNRMAGLWRMYQLRTIKYPITLQECSLRDSRPWRAVGMPIWDLWRLYELGLWEARWPWRPEPGPILTPDGVEIPGGGNPPIHGDDLAYRFSVFLKSRIQKEVQEE